MHLAEGLGAKVLPGSEAVDVAPLGKANGSEGYRVTWRSSTSLFGRGGSSTCRGVVFSGGVLGTVKLLAALRRSSLPALSERVGYDVRTNWESLMGVMTFDKATKFSDGVAIGSILQTHRHSFLEPVRYPSGSGFWRLFMAPPAHGASVIARIIKMLGDLARHPARNLRVYFVRNWAEKTQILLFMRTLDGTLRLTPGPFGLRTEKDRGPAPTAFIPAAKVRVTKPLSSADTTTPPQNLVLPAFQGIVPPPAGTPTRDWILKETFDLATGVPIHVRVNGLWFDDDIEDFPEEGSTEIWNYVNLTGDTHPMHPHLIKFQVLGRVPFNVAAFDLDWTAWIDAGRNPATKPSALAYATEPRQAPSPDEIGWKDTVKTDPGMITQIVGQFDIPPGSETGMSGGYEYVHHCHILEHEENEMMRPFAVLPQ